MNVDLPKTAAKTLMRAFPSAPKPGDLSLQEVFDQPLYLDAPRAEQDAIKLRSARFRYELEASMSWVDKWFASVPEAEFVGRSVLDLGCFTGGRLVYWKERYGFDDVRGIDIREVYAEAAALFAAERGVAAEFATGFAEALPYDDDTFDFIVSTDVLEHVNDVAAVMAECFRVLRPGGRLLVVFPQYFQPLEAHLTFTTRLPALHWIFSGSTLARAVHEIHRERGEAASWYALGSPDLPPTRKLPSLNGITVRRFREILGQRPWTVSSQNRAPILTSGRRASKPIFRALRTLFAIPARLPVLEELFLDRICFVLKKPGPKSDQGYVRSSPTWVGW